MLEVRNLHASVEGTEILRGVDLKVNADEGTVALRELGKDGQNLLSLDDVIARLEKEASPPDMR